MENKTLVVVVDGTIAMAPHWESIRTSILDSIVRKFCTNLTSILQDPFDREYSLHLVVFGAPDPYSVVRLRWSTDMDSFMYQLSRLTFIEGAQIKSTLEEGLCAALKMFPPTQGQMDEQLLSKRQCILVTASELSLWPRYVSVPTGRTIEMPGVTGNIAQNIFTDAEYLAALFAKSFISLSVICPKKMQTMRKLYNAGSGYYQIPGAFPIEFRHPEFLILISEKFLGARDALKNLQENRETLSQHDSLFQLAQNFPTEQLNMILEQMISEPSVHKPENSSGDSVGKPPMDDGNSRYSDFPVQENHQENGQSSMGPMTFTMEEMDTWPYEGMGSNYGSTPMNLQDQAPDQTVGLVDQAASSSIGGSYTMPLRGTLTTTGPDEGSSSYNPRSRSSTFPSLEKWLGRFDLEAITSVLVELHNMPSSESD